jgi:hypothetical protein
MRLLRESAMNTLPATSTATPEGLLRLAAEAGPPSPPSPALPSPASVAMLPDVALLARATRRTRLLSESAMNTLPPATSTATPDG